MEIEKAFLAALIKYPNELVNVDVPVEAISNSRLRIIYAGIATLWSAGHTVDMFGLIKHLNGAVSPVEIDQLMDIIPLKSAILHYAGEINRDFQKRRITAELAKMITDIKTDTADNVLGNLTELVANEMHITKKNPGITAILDRFEKTQEKNREHGFGLDTGFESFNSKYITYQENHCWIVGAFTSTGKTSFMIEQTDRLYKYNNKARSVIISTEMDEKQNIARMIAHKTGFASNYILSGRIREAHQDAVRIAKEEISGRNMKIYDDIYDLSEIKAVLRKAQLQGGVDVVFIDYAQNITVKGTRSEYEATDAISKGIQKLAKECACTIIVFSQLSNSAAKDDEGILQYKGGGTLSAIADVGIIMRKNKDYPGMVLLEVRKNRHGRLLSQMFRFSENYTQLEEVDHESNE